MKYINLSSRAARQVIRQEYGNSRNYISPQIIGYAVISRDALYCEISRRVNRAIHIDYVISVVEKCKDGTTTRRTDLSKRLSNMAQVYSEIEAMQEIYR